MFFSPEEGENFVYPERLAVDFDKRAEFDAGPLDAAEINLKIRELMRQGYGTHRGAEPGREARRSRVGILNRLQSDDSRAAWATSAAA